jgi:hypothetical protein
MDPLPVLLRGGSDRRSGRVDTAFPNNTIQYRSAKRASEALDRIFWSLMAKMVVIFDHYY